MSRCCDHSHQQPPTRHEHDHEPALQASVVEPLDGAVTTRIRIEQMDCPTEERLIREQFV